MKRIVLWTTATVVLVLMAAVILRADARRSGGWCGHGWRHRGPVSVMAHELKLNQTQVEKIRTLWLAQRPTISANLHEFLAENKEMNAIAAQENPDQSKVQEIADREAATIAKLLVEKMRLQSKIDSTILTPEQRAKADELQKRWESRLDRVADRLLTQPTEK
jgi:Spy/CpxP family protein refolding chaperone